LLLDSDFWKALGDEFRSVEDCARVNALWVENGQTVSGVEWQLTGKLSPRLRFEALARRSGSRLDPHCSDPFIAWLGALREVKSDLVSSSGIVGTFPAGRIQCVCAVSADYCKLLESVALQQEHAANAEKVKQSDPRNWSPLRQEWEAFKIIKTLGTGPREQIPEAVVRLALAKQYGVKPGDVTWKQIRHEVADLLRHYPAITIIPTDPNNSFGELPLQETDSNPTADNKPDCKARRIAEVAAFLAECNKHSTTRIYKKHIWRSAGHTRARQFEYWQDCNDAKATAEDQRNFPRILNYSPEEFVALLKLQKLIPEH
jgi:hypothetical protein